MFYWNQNWPERNKQLERVSSASHPRSRGHRISECFSLPVLPCPLMICSCSSAPTRGSTIPQQKRSGVSGCRDPTPLLKHLPWGTGTEAGYYLFSETRPKLRKRRNRRLTKEIIEDGCAQVCSVYVSPFHFDQHEVTGEHIYFSNATLLQHEDISLSRGQKRT